MEVIDVHAHLIAPDAVAALAEALPDRAPVFEERVEGRFLVYPSGRVSGPLPEGMTDLDVRSADMDGQGVDVQLLSPSPPQFGYGLPLAEARIQAAIVNDATLAAAETDPRRFRGLLTLPLQDAEAAGEELERVGGHRLVRGVELGATVAGDNLDDPRFEPLWDELERRRLVVLVHAAPPEAPMWSRHFLRNLVGNPLDTTLALASLVFGGVIERHPALVLCFVHAGGFAPYQVGRWDHAWRMRDDLRARIPQPPSAYLGRVYVDTITHDRAALEFLGERVGWSRILLGSDYCFDMASADPVGDVRALGLDAEDERAVLGGNLLALLERIDHTETGS